MITISKDKVSKTN